ncbi:hypothetical protein AB0B89_12480 [Sphaerisporangium sp. NPDC049002]|uniref:hypothetical protein n=1 Tax=unclassified Sphaerisporangium TaxID=2630420 RepID=UPI0033EB846F
MSLASGPPAGVRSWTMVQVLRMSLSWAVLTEASLSFLGAMARLVASSGRLRVALGEQS